MKKIVYINCYADPWIKVAEKMRDEYGYEPIYWSGYLEDNSEKLVPGHFPNIIYQKYYDAWKGIFSPEIEERAHSTYLDIDFLRQNASYELQAIKMCDRLDYDQYSFNFMERQRHFRNLLRKWQAFIDLYKPDLVVTPTIPHRVYDYALFLLCKYRGIRFLFFNHTSFTDAGRYMVLDDIYSINDLFVDDYNRYINDENFEPNIPDDIKGRYNRIRNNYFDGQPSFMARDTKGDKGSSGFINLLKKYVRELGKNGNQTLIDSLVQGIQCHGKRKGVDFLDSNYTILGYSIFKLRSNRFKKNLHKYYKTLCVKPDFTRKYVFFGLHYQPEATTCPSGDIFVDQILCIEKLVENLPKDYIVYVKEHPHQFMTHREGHTSRIKEFYKDLCKIPNVYLLDNNEQTYPLIMNSKAIATILGTVGWESIVYQKPLILFGLSWYENSPGVYRVRDNASATGIYDFITKYKFDQKALLAYLTSVGKNTYTAYYYKASVKGHIKMEEDACVKEILRSITDNI